MYTHALTSTQPEAPVPAQPIINSLATKLGGEIARAETQQVRADVLAAELATTRAQLDDARSLVSELTDQLQRARSRPSPGPTGRGAPTA